MRGIRGSRRIGRGVGLGAALVLSILAYHRWSDLFTGRLTHAMWNAKLAAQVLVWARSSDETIGLSQFASFLVAMAFVFGITGAFALVRVALARVRVLRIPGACLDVAVAVLAWRLAAHLSPFAGVLALATLGVSALSVAVYCGRGRAVSREAGPVARAAIVLGSETATLAWALWSFFHDALGLLVLLPIFALFALVGARIASASRDTSRSARDAVAGAPLLVLPFVDLLRSPSPWWCLSVCACVLALRIALETDGLSRRFTRIPEILVTSLAPLGTAAIFFLPFRFREFANVSNHHHEAQHLGWISSVTFGRFLFADCSYIYGPLREYALLVIAWALGGLTTEHVRLAHLVLTIVGTAIILVVGWRVARGRPWIFVMWGYLLLARTPLYYFLDYFGNLNFGWVDGARASFALLALVGALDAAERFDGSKRAHRVLFAWGALAGASVLYSHDTGVVAVVAVCIALTVDALLRPRSLLLRARAERLARVGGAFAAGTAAVLGLFAFIYVVAGRGRGLLGALAFVKELSAGVATARPYPINAHDLLAPGTLFAMLPPSRFDYVLPPAILALGAVTLVASIAYARWSARSTLLLAILAFSCVLYRYALMRSDEWHLAAGAIGAYLLLVALVTDATSLRFHLEVAGRRRTIPVVAVAITALMLVAVFASEHDGGLAPRLRRIASGEEHPSTGPRYAYPNYPGLRRIGDENVETSVLDVVKYVREQTSATEPIWCVTDFLDGGEIYFLAERRDATHFDIWSDVITTRESHILLDDLRRDPPTLIIGHGWHDYEPAVTDYVKAHWKHVDHVAAQDILRYDPTTGR